MVILGVWEQLNNPNFKPPEFGGIRMEAGSLLPERHTCSRATEPLGSVGCAFLIYNSANTWET